MTRSFGDHVAVHPTDVTIGPGGITGLLGPNGAGKSTLMRMLLGLVPADSGTCSIDGIALRGDGVALRARATYSPGEIGVYGEMKARDQIAWLLRGREPAALERALAIVGGMGIPLQRRVRGFSHGMKRMLLLAAALAPEVPVRILDEPSEGLDPSRRGEVLELLQADAERGTTILLSSHHLGEIDRVCDRLLFLREGRLLDEQQAGDVRERVKRILRLEWAEDIDPGVAHEVFAPFGTTRVEAERVFLLLETDDPRPALAALAASPELEAPTGFSFGQLSLGDLYREIYGREGI